MNEIKYGNEQSKNKTHTPRPGRRLSLREQVKSLSALLKMTQEQLMIIVQEFDPQGECKTVHEFIAKIKTNGHGGGA